jgi:hypothetical protein
MLWGLTSFMFHFSESSLQSSLTRQALRRHVTVNCQVSLAGTEALLHHLVWHG